MYPLIFLFCIYLLAPVNYHFYIIVFGIVYFLSFVIDLFLTLYNDYLDTEIKIAKLIEQELLEQEQELELDNKEISHIYGHNLLGHLDVYDIFEFIKIDDRVYEFVGITKMDNELIPEQELLDNQILITGGLIYEFVSSI